MDAQHEKSTLILIKRLLCASYHYCQKFHATKKFDEINKNDNDRPLIGFYKKLLDDASCSGEVAYADVMAIACEWNMRSLMHAMAELLEEKDVPMAERAIVIQPAFLPLLAGNIKNAKGIANLLGYFIENAKKDITASVTEQINGLPVADCCEKFAGNIHAVCDEYKDVSLSRLFPSHLNEPLKQKLLTLFQIPNFKRIWDLSKEKSQTWDQKAKQAWLFNDDIMYWLSDGKIAIYLDESAAYNDLTEHPREIVQYYKTEKPYTHVTVYYGAGYQSFVGSNSDGSIEIHKGKTITSEPQWGAVTSLAAWNEAIIAGYQSGAVVLFDGETVKILNEPGTTSKIENSAKKARIEVSSGCCKKVAINKLFFCAVYESGKILIGYCKLSSEQENIAAQLSAPVNDPCHITLVHFGCHLLYIGCQDGTVFMYDLDKLRIEAELGLRGLLKNMNTEKPVLCMADLYEDDADYNVVNKKYVAVGYKGGPVCIWNNETKKILKVIQRAGDADPVGVDVSYAKFLDIAYSDGVLDRHFLPDCSDLWAILYVLKKGDLG